MAQETLNISIKGIHLHLFVLSAHSGQNPIQFALEN